MPETLVETLQGIIIGPLRSWVAFRQGSCVVFTRPEGDLEEAARRILREWGPVRGGEEDPSAAFTVVTLPDHPGWIVTCHHPDLLTYVAPEEVGKAASEREVGLFGRSKRERDAAELEVVHVEDCRRSSA